ncbi:MAG: two-component sensor histidine kinase [Proteobacteria bacterium]|nr:two-component sensor histidine kinase [Pseudomonadota bacterium]MBU4471918.1 two-component sensor histidine kinase [Pseudomonadota bacterium]MCG2752806.1 ATP-binding protein [Desulfobacteraceae bacterium]
MFNNPNPNGNKPKTDLRPLKQPYYRSLTRNLVLIIVIVTFTPGALVMGTILRQFSSSYHEKVYSHLQELVQKHKQNINSFLFEKLADIRLLVETHDLEEFSDEDHLEVLLKTLQKEFGPVFVDLGLINEEGVQIAYAGPFRLIKAEYSNAEWYKNAKKNDLYISDVFLGLRGHPHFIVAVQHRWNNQSWMVRATIDFKSFNSVVENLQVGNTGFAFILNRRGEFQTGTRKDFEPEAIGFEDFFRLGDILKNKIQYFERVGKSGKKYIYLGTLLKDDQWLLIFRQEFNDALSGLISLQRITLIISLLGGLGIITISILLSRRMVNRIAMADREKEMMNQQVIETGKLASIGELAAGIAHEINNPIAIMVEEAGWIQDIIEDEKFENPENKNELDRALKQINTQGKRCKEITHKLLSFARKTDSRIQQVNINNLVKELVGISAQRAKYSNVALETEYDENVLDLNISPSEMQQVLLNMINNALDAMDKKGGKLTIATSNKENYVSIRIQDNGPGIHPDHLARIFDPFFTTKPVGKGTGLGLSICYGIINKMGGKIDVKSAVGVGTAFEILIPAVNSEDSEEEPTGGK